MKKIISMFLVIALLSGLAACEKGPFEKVGQKTDNVLQKASDKIQNKGPAQKAGNRLDEVTNN